jgi:hypothetical protein
MIIRTTDASLLLVTQPDHAALARRVINHWMTDGFASAPRRASILHAVAEHDNGWRDVDAAPLVDGRSGRILDFVSAPVELRQGIWPRGVGRLGDDPVAAALVAQHAIQIYSRFHGDADWTAFFSRMAVLRDQYCAAAALPLDALERDYFFLRIADVISLTFCSAWTDPQRVGEYGIRLDGSVLTIHPDPFAGGRVPLEVPARRMANRSFSSSADAAAVFRASPEVRVTGVAMG